MSFLTVMESVIKTICRKSGGLAVFLFSVIQLLAAQEMVLIQTSTPRERAAMAAQCISLYWDFGDALLCDVDDAGLAALLDRKVSVRIVEKPASGQGGLFIVSNADESIRSLLDKGVNLYRSNWLVSVTLDDAFALKDRGYVLVRFPEQPHPFIVPGFSDPAIRFSSNPLIKKAIDAVNQDTMTQLLRRLQKFKTRNSTTDSCRKSEEFIYNYMKTMGLDSVGYTQWTGTRYTARNIIGTQLGTEKPESVVVVCGHLDSYGSSTSVAPGVDDNGTGTAGTVEAARILAKMKFRWTIRYCVFTGEEQWMLGSTSWVTKYAVPAKMKIYGVYNLDMFGVPGYQDKNKVFISPNTASQVLTTLANDINKTYSLGLTIDGTVKNDAAGDHTPFWQNGYKAIFFIEADEKDIWAGTAAPHYHKASDTLGNINMSLFVRGVQVAIGCLANLATPVDVSGIEKTISAPLSGKVVIANSTSRSVTIYIPGHVSGELSVFDVQGKRIASVNSHNGTYIWNGTDKTGSLVARGIYGYSITTQHGIQQSGKLSF